MRSLTQPKVLGRALLAAIVACALCYPRLAAWEERGFPLTLMMPVFAWAMFVLWGFVFAWHFEYGRRPVLGLETFNGKFWSIVSLITAGAALGLHYLVDPKLRVLTPEVYPTEWNSWVRTSLFAVAFEPLFLCFAPYAFFIRLTKRQDAAITMTVVFGLFLLALRINAAHTILSAWLLIELASLRVLAGFAQVYLYLKGGALLVWWVVFILQLRLILDFI
jgi:hypothetical protein